MGNTPVPELCGFGTQGGGSCFFLLVDLGHAGHIHNCPAPDEGQEMEASDPDRPEIQQVDVETGFVGYPSALNFEGAEVGSPS